MKQQENNVGSYIQSGGKSRRTKENRSNGKQLEDWEVVENEVGRIGRIGRWKQDWEDWEVVEKES